MLFRLSWYTNESIEFLEVTMAKGARENIKMKSTESAECYWTVKNKRNTTQRLERRKYDKSLKRHVIFKEAK
jgi:large subunit ribosomal protein L33